MITQELRDFLNRNHVAHQTIEHARTYTAQQTAQAAHVKGRELAKTVILSVDGCMCMAVLPAHYHIDLDRFRMLTGTDHVEVAPECDIMHLFPHCETGAMPPFGNLYGMEVWVQQDLTKDRDIAFNGGTHSEVVRMLWSDYSTLVHPCIGDFAQRH